MRLGIIGGGVVGRATARAWMEHADVRVYDVAPERGTHLLADALDADAVMVCLPTPQAENGLACDTSAVDQFFAQVGKHPSWRLRSYALRSTVPVGTTRRLRAETGVENIVHYPEFLTARCAAADAITPARHVIGGHVCDAAVTLAQALEKRFPGVPVYLMGSDESELTKLALNAFFAVKVAYFNEVRSFADGMGLDWRSVHKGLLSDGRIAHAHTAVPGPDGRRGFGGSCLPKDLASFVSQIEARGLRAVMTGAAVERNAIDRGGRP
jgi:nucleotide sugar dehydrogenase